MLRRFILPAGLPLFVLVMAGCSKSTNPAKTGSATATVILKAKGPSADGLAKPVIASVALTEAQVVIHRLRFDGAEDNDEFDFRLRKPLIVTLSLTGAEQTLGEFEITPGTFDRTRFRIEKLDNEDGALFQDNPDLQNKSLRASGFVNGLPESTFVFTSSFDEEQEKRFEEPITLKAGETTTVIFWFDTSKWFVQGGQPLDPRDPENRDEIENNIKAAFKITKEE